MTNHTQFWYVLQKQDQTCKIVTCNFPQTKTPKEKQWGPFSSKQEAIAKRIGLIRSRKCKPLIAK